MIHHLGLIKKAFPHIRTNNENTQFEHILFIIYSQAIVHYVIVRLNHRFITFGSMVDQWTINQLAQYHLHFNMSFKYSCFFRYQIYLDILYFTRPFHTKTNICALADPRSAMDVRPPVSKFFHFHAVFGKNIGSSGKSWIHHWCFIILYLQAQMCALSL